MEPSAFDRCGAAFDEVVAPLARGEASAAAAAAAEDAILPHRLKCSTGGKSGQTAAQLAGKIGGCLSIRSGTFLYAPVEKRSERREEAVERRGEERRGEKRREEKRKRREERGEMMNYG